MLQRKRHKTCWGGLYRRKVGRHNQSAPFQNGLLMSPILRRLLCLSLCTALLACSGPDRSGPPKAVLLFSPNGEPITGGPLGQRPCAEAMGIWFDHLDSQHRDALSREAFLADARAQFAKMDLDHDGWITPAELSIYREPYTPPAEPVRRRPSAPPSDGPNGGGPERREQNAAPPPARSSIIQEDPVMAADLGLKFRVSLDDFLTQAGEVFDRLDRSHKGSLNRADAVASCPAKISARQILPGKTVI